jgi:bifunctional non-homologous end joining protein LigD
VLPARREEIPRFIEPMLASTREMPIGEEWAFEVKWDGARMQPRFDGRAISMRSRHGRACADEFPEVAALGDTVGRRRIFLTGELICLASNGKPDFAALRARFGRRDPRGLRMARRRRPARLIVFDVLHLDGLAVRELPYRKRRELLAELELDGPRLVHPTTHPRRHRRSSTTATGTRSRPADAGRSDSFPFRA